jgi:hypothetical protein
MNLEEEQAKIQRLLDFYYFLEESMSVAKETYGKKLHEETFIRRMCQENSINIQDFSQMIDFLTEIAKDHPDKFKML